MPSMAYFPGAATGGPGDKGNKVDCGQRTVASLLAVVAVLLGIDHAAVGGGDVELCFNFDGTELPSSEPNIQYFSTAGLAESAAFSVSAGLLQQQLLPAIGATGYFYPEVNGTDGGLYPTKPLVIEARLRVLQLESIGAPGGGAWFGAVDGTHDHFVSFSDDGAWVKAGPGEHWLLVPVDVFVFHIYRIESPADSPELRFYIDGSLQLVTEALPLALNEFRWGGGTLFTEASGDAIWDWVRLSQTGHLCAAACLAADIDGDGAVGIGDFLLILAQWGPCPPECFADVNGDGTVGILDFLEVLGQWGPCE